MGAKRRSPIQRPSSRLAKIMGAAAIVPVNRQPRPADFEFSERRAGRSPGDIDRMRRVKGLREHAHERNGRAQRVADRRVAAPRLPATEAVGFKPQPDDAIKPARKDVAGASCTMSLPPFALRGLAAELVCKGLAVVASTDHTINRPRRRVGQDPPHLAATTTYLNLSVHPFPASETSRSLPADAARTRANPRQGAGRSKLAAANRPEPEYVDMPAQYFSSLMPRRPCGGAAGSHVPSRECRFRTPGG